MSSKTLIDTGFSGIFLFQWLQNGYKYFFTIILLVAMFIIMQCLSHPVFQLLRFACLGNAMDYCNSHIRLKEDELNEVIFTILEIKSEAIFGMSLQLKQKKNSINKSLEIKKSELAILKTDIDKNQKYLKSLYENLVTGVLDLDEYKVLKQGYEEKIESARNKHFEIETQLKELSKQVSDLKVLGKNIKSAQQKKNISRAFVETLIDKIIVTDKYNIDIIFSFENAFPLVREVLSNV